jgi:hypothetical protein
MIIINCEQNSPVWDAIRLGLPTSSSFDKIITTAGVRSKQRDKYLYKLAGERASGEKSEHYYGSAMALGHEREDESRKLYEFLNECDVQQIGFCFFDESKTFGSSTDGLVGDDGIFETKNALSHVQIERLEKGWSKAEHFQQVQGELYVTGRKWCDLVSYSRGLKPIITRFKRDEKFITRLAEELQLFIEDLDQLVIKHAA